MTQYQVAIFSGDSEDDSKRLRDTLRKRLAELGIPNDFLVFLGHEAVLTRDPKAPIVGVYFAGEAGPRPSPGLNELVNDATTIIPVVELARFSELVPAELHEYNGMELLPEDPDLDQVANVVLENFGLLRRSRRLFISYRRAETRAIAIQLYELLDGQAFDVFLDTQGVRPGERFQEILWHRLVDTDVVVLLDSPGFLVSRWTAEELARANSTNIQILQLVWPDNALEAVAAFSRPMPLQATDFTDAAHLGDGARLTLDCLRRVGIEVESLRARALAARYAYLVQEFCSTARDAGLEVVPQYERFIQLRAMNGNEVIAVPTIGVPDAARYQEVEEEVSRHSSTPAELLLLYDERGIRDEWLEHIAWLDRQLHVRSLQVTQIPSWVRRYSQ